MNTVTPAVCRAARGLVDWSQEELAREAGVGLSTIRNFEKGRSEPRGVVLAAMRAALERAGVMLLDDGGEEGVKRQKTAELPSASSIEPT